MDRFTANFEDHRDMKDGDALAFTTPPVQIIVGSEEGHKECFYVHEQVLPKDGFFAAALKKQWREGQQGVVNLPEETPEIFSIYLQWLYEKKLRLMSGPETTQEEYIILAELYALGEKMMDTIFTSRVLDAFIATIVEWRGGTRVWPSHEAANIIYKSTPQNSPARKMMVALYVYSGMSKPIDRDLHLSNHEFLVDLSRALLEQRPRGIFAPDVSPEDLLEQLARFDYVPSRTETKTEPDSADDEMRNVSMREWAPPVDFSG